MDVFYIICVTIVSTILVLFIVCFIVNDFFEQRDFTSKRKEKYLKNKEKQIIEQLEFEKDVYVRKVIIDKKLYGYVFFTKIYAWQGKVYPQIFETLDELVDFVKKLEKKGKK